MKKVVPVIIVLLILIFGGYVIYRQHVYSDGHRAGVLIKFSKKGNFFKTYEGEINQVGLNQDQKMGLVNNLWDFSVKDDAAASALNGMEGKNVVVHYIELNKSFFWQGETNYFVDSVTIVK